MRVNWLSVGLGAVLLLSFPFTLYIYVKTGCVRTFFNQFVCDGNAKVAIMIYALSAIFGFYLIITGIKRKGKDEKNNENGKK